MTQATERRIVLTGGGSTGHVAVNLALIPRLQARGWNITYMGSKKGIERTLLADFPEVTYLPISTGKLRRYWSFENVVDVFRVARGIFQAWRLLRKIRPQVIFSKGGFVAVPVVYGGGWNRIPALTHESDVTPGLANKLCYRYAEKVFVTFEQTLQYLPAGKGEYIGPIIREQIRGGDAARGRAHYGFRGEKPILLVLGGSLGAGAINTCVWDHLDRLLQTFDILHGTGAGKGRPELSRPGYRQVDYIKEDMGDVLAMADCIVSRAGSNAIFEFLYYQKPMLLIPLSKEQSRGDQIVNARCFEALGYARVLEESALSSDAFLRAVEQTYDERAQLREKQASFPFQDGMARILQCLEDVAEGKRPGELAGNPPRL